MSNIIACSGARCEKVYYARALGGEYDPKVLADLQCRTVEDCNGEDAYCFHPEDVGAPPVGGCEVLELK